jgi:hypothetical protein
MPPISLVARPRCSLHEGARADFVNDLLARGWSATNIASAATKAGLHIRVETITAHRRVCFGRETTAEAEMSKADLAILVRDRVAKELGALPVTVKDGLMAQQLIDRREEQRRDRQFMVNLARLLSGGGPVRPETAHRGRVFGGSDRESTPGPPRSA